MSKPSRDGRRTSCRRSFLPLALALIATPVAAQTVSIVSTPANGAHYVSGEAITTRISGVAGVYSVTGGPFTNNRMAINIGGTTRQAAPSSGCCGGRTSFDFSYTVTRDDIDTNGITIPANSISGPNWHPFGSIVNTINRNHAALTDQANHKVIGSAAAVASTSPAALTSANLTNATLRISLTGTTFGASVTAAHFSVNPSAGFTGLSVTSVSGVTTGGTTATLTLFYTGGAITSAQTFTVTVAAAAHAGTLALNTGSVNVNPPGSVAVTSTSPAVLDSGNLNGARLNLSLTNTNFGASVTAASFTVNPSAGLAGLSVTGVSGVTSGGTTATLTLSYTGGAITGAQTFTVTVAATAHAGTLALNTGSVSVNFLITVAVTSTNPPSLDSANLDGARLDLSLTNTTFGASVTPANFSVNPSAELTGLDVAGVAGATSGGTTATLTLSYTGGRITTAQTFTVTVAAAAHAGTNALTTGSINVEPPPQSDPPTVVGTVDDLDLALGKSAQVRITGLFTDEAPDRLTYSVSSSNPTAVLARLAWPSLEVAGLSHGAATVTLTATNEGGLSATLSFTVQSGTAIAFAADASAPEGGLIRLQLAASRPAQRALSVPYRLSGLSDSTTFTVRHRELPMSQDSNYADDSDHAGGAGGTATFAAGATSAEIVVGVLDDDVVEPVREHFLVTLAEPATNAAYGLGLKAEATATIDEGVCDRAAAVRDALRRGGPCAAVADLSRHTALRLPRTGITQLRVEDLLQLDQLRLLDLSGNRLTAWPTDVLAELPLLTSLRLDGNQIASLPRAIGTHRQLTELNLSRNQLTMLPAGAAQGLAALEHLHLSDNALTTLPTGMLDGLARLRELSLDGNALRELPAGLFVGIGRLESLQLQRNPGTPFVLTVEPTRTDAAPWAPGPASIAMRVPSGAPFAMHSVLSAPGASLSDSESLSVPAGATLSETVTVAAETPVIARLSWPEDPRRECEFSPGAFRPCFQGITTAPAPLVLFKRPPRTTAPIPEQALDTADALRLDLAAFFEAADEEALRLAARSSAREVASAHVIDGVLVVEALQEGVATVVVTATDRYGQAATLRFNLQVMMPPSNRWGGWRSAVLNAPSEQP